MTALKAFIARRAFRVDASHVVFLAGTLNAVTLMILLTVALGAALIVVDIIRCVLNV